MQAGKLWKGQTAEFNGYVEADDSSVALNLPLKR
jgi:hypothetical protein